MAATEHKYEPYDLELLLKIDNPQSGPHSYIDACKRFMPWVCPKCKHLMDIWPQKEKFAFRCGPPCNIVVVVEENHDFIEIEDKE